jgi:anti-sigma factor RsiW
VGVAERSHTWVREQLASAADGTLSADEQRALDAHLAACRPCAAYRRTLQATVRLLEGLPSARPAKASPEAKRRILDALP